MTAVRLLIEPYGVQLGATVGTASRRTGQRAGVLVTLEHDGGFGQGEAAPLPDYSDDSLPEAVASLRGFDPNRLEAICKLGAASPQTLLPTLAEASRELPPSAAFALETALLDWLSRQRGLPLARLLRQLQPELPEPAAELGLAALIAGLDDAATALSRGFGTLKFKLGGARGFEHERDTLRTLRHELGAQFRLRLDANRGLALAQAREQLASLRELDIEFIEEPCAEWLREPPLDVALDESLRARQKLSAERLRSHRVRAFVLKPTVLGGFVRCFELARLARRAGVALVVSHTFEGVVGFAACGALARALAESGLAQGLGPHAALEPWGAGLAAGSLGGTLHDSRQGEPGLGLPRLQVPR